MGRENVHLLEKRLEEILKKHQIAGMAVAITDRRKVLFAKGFGVDSVERMHVPAEAESLYRIASISKVVTGITVLRLAEQGVLDLDAPVKAYVPWLSFSRPEALEQMTLRHLLSHTSGLPMEYTPDGPREERALEQTLKDGLKELEFKTLPEDGVYLYSNWGIRLASYITQVRTGKLFSELARELVLTPLQMDRTTFDLQVAATYPLSLPHTENARGELEVVHRIKENAARLAAGGLYSNVLDLCKLARFLLNDGKNDLGQQILNKDSIKQMVTKHAVKDVAVGDGYGLTMHLRKYKDRFLHGHLGSAPPYATSMLVDPVSGYGVVTLMNTKRDELRCAIPEMIFDMLNGETL